MLPFFLAKKRKVTERKFAPTSATAVNSAILASEEGIVLLKNTDPQAGPLYFLRELKRTATCTAFAAPAALQTAGGRVRRTQV